MATTGSASRNKKPHHESRSYCFFRIMNLNHCRASQQDLMIPPEVTHIWKEPFGTVTLEGPSGDHWKAKVSRKPDGIYLQDGWEKFVRDNSLKDYDFLIFTYTRKLFFQVQIFDKNGCERLDSSMFKSPQEQQVPQPEANSSKKIKRKNEIRHEEEGSCSKMKTAEKIQPHGRTPLTEEEKAFLSGVFQSLFTPKYPYFWKFMRKTYVERQGYLPIPKQFVQENLSKFTKNVIILQNSQGKIWEVSCGNTANMTYFRKGWSAFVQENSVKEGDLCIFELIAENKVQVHIFT